MKQSDRILTSPSVIFLSAILFTALFPAMATQVFQYSGASGDDSFHVSTAIINATLVLGPALPFAAAGFFRRRGYGRWKIWATVVLGICAYTISALNVLLSDSRMRLHLASVVGQMTSDRAALTADDARRRELDTRELVRIDRDIELLRWQPNDDAAAPLAALKSDNRWSLAGECRVFESRFRSFCAKHEELAQRQRRHNRYEQLSLERNAVLIRLQRPLSQSAAPVSKGAGSEWFAMAAYFRVDVDTAIFSRSAFTSLVIEALLDLSLFILTNFIDETVLSRKRKPRSVVAPHMRGRKQRAEVRPQTDQPPVVDFEETSTPENRAKVSGERWSQLWHRTMARVQKRQHADLYQPRIRRLWWVVPIVILIAVIAVMALGLRPNAIMVAFSG